MENKGNRKTRETALDTLTETVGLSKDDAAEIMLVLRRCAPTPNGKH